MEVVSFRIPKELKRSMQRAGVNWSEELRKFIEAKVRECVGRKALEEIDAMLADLPRTERGTARRYVREDRDGN